MRIAFLLYPTASVRPDEDSSFWIIRELSSRGHAVFHFESKNLVLINNQPCARLRAARTDAKKGFLPSPQMPEFSDLGALDAVFIRKEPPFDEEYVNALQILSRLRGKTLLLNDPIGILLCNEKLGIRSAARYFPEQLCSADPADLEAFARKAGGRVVVKPLDEKSGYGVIATSWKDRSFRSIVQSASRKGTRRLLLQRFVEPGRLGERRILILGGEILGVFKRLPHPRDFRANLGLGGRMRRAAVSAFDRRMVEEIAGECAELGLHFVGIDACGEKILEINVTSPSGIPELNELDGTRLEKRVADFIERRLGPGRAGRRRSGASS